MNHNRPAIRYPRRLFIRVVLRGLNRVLFRLLTYLEVTGEENLPDGGPLLVVVNHFSYVDPAVVVCVTP
jgi:1-acyl-sn-glycerol-3-phosphate acyltransferase